MLYIAGWGRSGSTFLSAMLGEVDGVFAAGEVRSVWERGQRQRRLCGCGLPVPDCPVWSRVIPYAAADADAMTADEVSEFQLHRLRTRHYLWKWARAMVRARPDRPTVRYVNAWVRLYEGLGRETGVPVVLDSSKYPLDAHLLATVGHVDLRVVHLVRDPRAVAYSWTRRKALRDTAAGQEEYLRRFSPLASSVIWSIWNTVVETVLRRDLGSDKVLRLRYDDLVARPEASLAAILALAGVDAPPPPVEDGTVHLDGNHMVSGNPSRFTGGDVRIRNDDEWQAKMGSADRLLAVLPALPLLRRYGYPLRSR